MDPIQPRDDEGAAAPRHMLRKSKALTFILLSYLFAWILWIPSAHASGFVWVRLGQSLLEVPKRALMVGLGNLGPGLAAIIVLLQERRSGRLRKLLAGLVPRGTTWTLAALMAPAALLVSVTACFGLSSVGVTSLASWERWLRLFAINLPLAPLWEELGWRGYLLPSFEASMSPLKASLAVGIIWGLWHMPLYFRTRVGGSSFGMFPLCFLIFTLGLSVVFAWVYNATRGRLSILVLLHASLNASTIVFMGGAMAIAGMRPFLAVTIAIWLVVAALLLFIGPGLSYVQAGSERETVAPQAL